MNTKMFPLILLGVLSSFVLKDANGLMCYKCNSLYDLDCVKLPDRRMGLNYHHCQPHKDNETVTEYKRPLCRKIRQKVKVRNNMIVLIRTCGWVRHQHSEEDVCYTNKNEDVDEVVCQCFKDECNGSAFNSTNTYLIFLLSGLLFVISYRK